MLRFLTILACLAAHLCRVAHSQDAPPIACPSYFQYLAYGNQYIGKITIPGSSARTVTLEASFSQRPPARNNYFGKLSLYEDQDTTIQKLRNGQPISYRVDFPLPNVLAKLTQIVINGDVVCSASGYAPPSTVFSLRHMLQLSTYGGGQALTPHIIYDPQPTVHDYSNTLAAPPTPTSVGPNFSNVGFQDVFQRPQSPPVEPPPTRPQGPPAQPSGTSTCGREGDAIIAPYIHGGTVISRGQFPWLTAIYRKKPGGLDFICGGSLLSTVSVLTAAHCFKEYDLTAVEVVVYLGRHNLENYSEEGAVSRDIRTLVINSEYDPEMYPDADLAILQMKSPVIFTRFILPICLWSESTDLNLVVGQTAYVAGWGGDEAGRRVTSLPKMVDTNIVSEGDCLRSESAFKAITSPRTLCAGKLDGTGPCMGDSGGGLMMNRSGVWMLRGIVSAGTKISGVCNLRKYVVYSDVAQHILWVRSNIL